MESTGGESSVHARRGDTRTRQRILAAARRLIEVGGGRSVPMSAIGREAGVSRQALYLHFADRTELVVEVLHAIDAEVRTEARPAGAGQVADGHGALRAAVARQGAIMPRLRAVVANLESLRADEPAVAAVLREREMVRLNRCRAVVGRLLSEGSLRPGLDCEAAAVLVWNATSHRSWEAACDVAGWTTDTWVEHTTAVLDEVLFGAAPSCDAPDHMLTGGPEYGAEIAGELAELGAQIVEAKYRRQHPACTDDAARSAVRAWWSDRRGAPDGDVSGAVRRR